MEKYFNTHRGWFKVVAIGIICLFLLNDFSYALEPGVIRKNAHTLSVTSGFNPIVSGADLAVVDANLKEMELTKGLELTQDFQEYAGFLYLSVLMGKAISRFGDKISAEGLRNFITGKLPQIEFTRFKWGELYKQDGAFCLPYTREGGGPKMTLRYCSPDTKGSRPLGIGNVNIIQQEPDIHITPADDFARAASRSVAEAIRKLQKDPENPKKEVVIVFATGTTMIGFFQELAGEKDIDWERVKAFHLDEYKGPSPDNEDSYADELNERLFKHVPILKKNIHYINGAQPDKNYMKKIKDSGGADIVMLGVGRRGHLAFNEASKDTSFNSRMREVELDDSTRKDNKTGYRHAYTMGLADIYEGRHLFFLANGPQKAPIVKKALEGPFTPECPASMIQRHPRVTVIL
ncbi:6-phosphogluconolactonase, partial [Candidatus Omnitrophota bacterium]